MASYMKLVTRGVMAAALCSGAFAAAGAQLVPAALVGVGRDSSGIPIPGVEVRFKGADFVSVRTNGSGGFRMGNLPPGRAGLLPGPYRDDPSAAGDVRRHTDSDLRATKRTDAQAVLDSLPSTKGRLELDRDQADRWLGALNDMRLALGTSLDVSEDMELEDLEADDPRLQALSIYSWLGYLQESLLSCLDPRV